jgi:hypothetical protein
MIAAIDIGGDRKSYGFELVLNSIRVKYGDVVTYIPNKSIGKTDFLAFPIVLCSFMFVDNFFDFLPTLKKAKIEPLAEKRGLPWIIAGGSSITENPLPIADFIDVAILGEGEGVILDVLKIIFSHRGEKNIEVLCEIASVDCAFVSAIEDTAQEKRPRQEDINRAISIPGYYTRPRIENKSFLEYSIEYHRGCKRKCKFCSYAHLQNPYREMNHDILHKKIIEISKYDPCRNNSIVLIQTNIFHIDLDTLKLIDSLGMLPCYSSACIADVFTPHGHDVLEFLGRRKQKIYLRFGVEDFTEEGRAKLGKPVSDEQLQQLPKMLPNGDFKLFFISHIPWQEVSHIQHFESILEKMSQNIISEVNIDMFVTILNCKKNTYFNKYAEFKEDIYNYLNDKFRRRYGKLKIGVFKNQGREAFEKINRISLGDRNYFKTNPTP